MRPSSISKSPRRSSSALTTVPPRIRTYLDIEAEGTTSGPLGGESLQSRHLSNEGCASHRDARGHAVALLPKRLRAVLSPVHDPARFAPGAPSASAWTCGAGRRAGFLATAARKTRAAAAGRGPNPGLEARGCSRRTAAILQVNTMVASNCSHALSLGPELHLSFVHAPRTVWRPPLAL
jgi:hypothetical protein